MKKINLLLLSLLSLTFALAGCSKNNDKQNDDPVPAPDTLKLSSQIVDISYLHPMDNYTYIVSGNGGYKIVFPKQIKVISPPYYMPEDSVDVDYSDQILALHFDNQDHIVVELKLLTGQDVLGNFMVADSKGQKRILVVCDMPLGIWYGDDYFKAIESRLLNDPDYWQQ